MHKGIIAYIVIFVILVIVIYFFARPHGFTPITTSTIKHVTTTINQSTSNSTTTSQSTTAVYGTCISPNENASIRNGNFSTGTYAGWTTQGYGFGSKPLNLSYANANHGYYETPWKGYEGNFVATTYSGGLSIETGNITSNPFLVVEPFLNFRLISPPNNNLYIEILQGSIPVIVTHFNTYNAPNNTNATSTFEAASIPLGVVMCQNVSIKIVANVGGTVTTHTGYIAAGDFYLSKTPVQAPGVVMNQTIV